jgi:aldose 1-epimerase
MKKLMIFLSTVLVFLSACDKKQLADNGFEALDKIVKAAAFEKTIDGKQTALFTLKNDSGVVVKITNYGGRIVSVLVPDKNGNYADINLGYASIDEYLNDAMYLGATVGRYANRIGNAKFKLDNKEYKLSANNGENSLHGGPTGFYSKVWDAKQNGDTLELSYLSPDMEEGYPGNLQVNLKYILTNDNELIMQYEATTDKKTIVNLTNHAYYNLKGEGEGDILDHVLEIFSDKITPVNKSLITDGSYMEVKGTAFDFNTPFPIGQRIKDSTEQMIFGNGYDHNWVLNKKATDSLELAVRLTEPVSGRVLELYTTEPGVQFYSGNFMDGKVTGKLGKPLIFRGAAAFEPQHYPNSPNIESYPSVTLEPGKTYKQTSILKFTVKK